MSATSSPSKARSRLEGLLVHRAERLSRKTSDTPPLTPNVRDRLRADVSSALNASKPHGEVIDSLVQKLRAPPLENTRSTVVGTPLPRDTPLHAQSVSAVELKARGATVASLGSSLVSLPNSYSKVKPMSVNPPPPTRSKVEKPNTNDIWAQMCRRDAELDKQERLAQKQKRRAALEAQREFLDQQAALKRERKLAAASHIYVEREELQQLKTELETEKVIVKERHEKEVAAEAEIREQQIALRRQLKAEAKQKQIAEDKELVERLKKEEADAKAAIERTRARAKSFVEATAAMNKEQMRIKAEEKERELALEDMYRRMFEERVEKEAAKRERDFAALKDKMTKKFEMGLKIGATVEEKAKLDEERAQIETNKRWQKREEDELNAIKKRKALTMEALRAREAQIKLKEERKALEHEQELKERAVFEENRVRAEQLQAEKEAERRERSRRHLEEVKAQMIEHAARPTVIMSDKELAINAKVLEKMAITPDARNTVLEHC